MRTNPVIYLAVIGLLFMAWSCAAPPTPVPVAVPERPEPPPSVGPLGTGKLYGSVSFEGNITEPLPVLVKVRGRYVQSDDQGKYVLTGMPDGNLRLVAEATGGGRRYLDLEKVALGEGEEKELNLLLEDATDLDRYCIECHPYRGEKVGPGQVLRDVHKSGFRPEKQMRTQELLDHRGHVTCESCHTLHEDTDENFFILYPYMNGNLCNRCH